MERRLLTTTAVIEQVARTDAEALQAALERIVFLECRVDQLDAAAVAERTAAERARDAVTAAAARESGQARRLGVLETELSAARAEAAELSRRLGHSEAARAAVEAEAHGRGEGLAEELAAARALAADERRRRGTREHALADARARVESLTGARERLFAKLVEWQRLAVDAGDSVDLAEFIAELRAEIVSLEQARVKSEAREGVLREELGRHGVDADDLLAGGGEPVVGSSQAQRLPALGGAEATSAREPATQRLPALGGAEATSAREPARLEVPESGAQAAGAVELAPTVGVGPVPAELAPTVAAGPVAAELAQPAAAPLTARARTAASAARFEAEGRLGIGAPEVRAALSDLPTAAEREAALRLAAEVAAGPDRLRLRAAVRLVDVAGRRAAPALASAVGAAADRMVRAELLEQLGRTAEPRALQVARRFLTDVAPEVRAAAVDACLRLASDPGAARVALAAGLADEDPRVRRRAALGVASARGLDPGALVAPLLADPDRQVRRLAAAALGGTREPVAATALLGALDDRDGAVRLAAAGAVRKLFGADAAAIVELPALARGREVARLRAFVSSNLARLAPDGRLVLPAPAPEEARAAAAPVAVLPAPAPEEARAAAVPLAEPVEQPPARTGGAPASEPPFALHHAGAAASPAAGQPAAAIVAAAPSPAASAAAEADAPWQDAPARPALDEIRGVVRMSLRGATEDALAAELGCDPDVLAVAVAAHVAEGRLLKRGKKIFLP